MERNEIFNRRYPIPKPRVWYGKLIVFGREWLYGVVEEAVLPWWVVLSLGARLRVVLENAPTTLESEKKCPNSNFILVRLGVHY